MKSSNFVKTIIKINQKKNIKGYENVLSSAVNDIKYKDDFHKLLLILIYNKCDDVLLYLIKNNIDFNIKKNNRNLLFYTTLLKYHKLTNILLDLKVNIQHEYAEFYFLNSIQSSIFYCHNDEPYNARLLLHLIYVGYDINQYEQNILNKLSINYYDYFKKKYRSQIEANKMKFIYWERRKMLTYIFHEKNKKNNHDLDVLIFTNDLLLHAIKEYL